MSSPTPTPNRSSITPADLAAQDELNNDILNSVFSQMSERLTQGGMTAHRLLTRLDSANQDNETYRKKLIEYHNMVATLQKELENQSIENDSLKTSLRESEQKILELESKLTKKDEELDLAQRTIQAWEIVGNNYKKTVVEAAAAGTDLQREVQQLIQAQNRIPSLQIQLRRIDSPVRAVPPSPRAQPSTSRVNQLNSQSIAIFDEVEGEENDEQESVGEGEENDDEQESGGGVEENDDEKESGGGGEENDDNDEQESGGGGEENDNNDEQEFGGEDGENENDDEQESGGEDEENENDDEQESGGEDAEVPVDEDEERARVKRAITKVFSTAWDLVRGAKTSQEDFRKQLYKEINKQMYGRYQKLTPKNPPSWWRNNFGRLRYSLKSEGSNHLAVEQ